MNGLAVLKLLAGNELRLHWRDWMAMMSGGRRGRERKVVLVVLLLCAGIHLIAYHMVAPYAAMTGEGDKFALLVMSGIIVLAFSLMASQAMESVTRAFYARADLDLLLSSPSSAAMIFAVRVVLIACSVTAMALLLAAPFINVVSAIGGLRWMAAYAVLAATGALATAFALITTLILFRCIGAARTRLVAQIVAAVTGAAFMIGLQAAAILFYGQMSRLAVLQSDMLLRETPDPHNMLWLLARAAFGSGPDLLLVAASAVAILALAIGLAAPRFARYAGAAAAAAQRVTQRRFHWKQRYGASPMQALRRKEWLLLLRDPWLLSQTLMQILYLLPPALFLWRTLREDSSAFLVILPVLVMAAGQLAGGLAWLAISGEDAPDLIASAPIDAEDVIRAKIEAVVACIALVFSPFVLVIAWLSPFHAVITLLGVTAAAGAAVMIQFWFRTQAKRSHFRRRQISSRLATFAEAFSSIAVAATTVFVAAQTWVAVLSAAIAFCVVGMARLMRPSTAATAAR
jgi:ABC-2 type transport system permease protein